METTSVSGFLGGGARDEGRRGGEGLAFGGGLEGEERKAEVWGFNFTAVWIKEVKL